jgi:hypothetical protein
MWQAPDVVQAYRRRGAFADRTRQRRLAQSRADNPASRAMLPESATKPTPTVAATRQDVQGILAALKGKPLARAAVAIVAFTGVRPAKRAACNSKAVADDLLGCVKKTCSVDVQ